MFKIVGFKAQKISLYGTPKMSQTLTDFCPQGTFRATLRVPRGAREPHSHGPLKGLPGSLRGPLKDS